MNNITPYFAVRKTLYGTKAFEVVEVVKETARTHELRTQDYYSTWSTPRRVMEPAAYPATFSSYADAVQSAQRGNDVWDSKGERIEAAKKALLDLTDVRQAEAFAAVRQGSGQ